MNRKKEMTCPCCTIILWKDDVIYFEGQVFCNFCGANLSREWK